MLHAATVSSEHLFYGGELEWAIEAALTELEQQQHALTMLETELHAFLEEYYCKVGHLFERLTALEMACATHTAPHDPLSLSHSLRSVYRKLAKQCHPDVYAGAPTDEQNDIRHVNAAYAQRNLSALKRLEYQVHRRAESTPGKQRTARLRITLQSIENCRHKVQLRMEQIKTSAEYELMRRVFWSKLCGLDLVSEIATETQAKISQLEAPSSTAPEVMLAD